MHVLIIPSEHFVTSTCPLAGIFQSQQANALHESGHKVGVISPGVITPRFLFRRYEYPEFEDSNGYPVYRRYVRKFYPQRSVSPERSISLYQDLGLDLYMLYKRRFGKPDIIHAHNVKFAGFIAQAVRDMDTVPYIITEHSSMFRAKILADKWLSPIKVAYQYASARTAVSRALSNDIGRQLGFHDIDVLPNIVETNLISGILKDNTGCDGDFVFLNIASLDANKDQSSLIEAFAMHFQCRRASLRIGGTGNMERHLKKLVRRLGVESQVVFLGYLDRHSVMREMQEADCFVLSSRQETFGVVLIEALACGTPVIATRCGGPEDIVNEDNGLLVAPGDIISMGEAMIQMSQAKGRYEAEALREECKTRFGKEAFIASANQFYATSRGFH